jgi:hypothetical protein
MVKTGYLGDYAAEFGDLMYVANEKSHDFAKFSSMVDARYQEWKSHSAND